MGLIDEDSDDLRWMGAGAKWPVGPGRGAIGFAALALSLLGGELMAAAGGENARLVGGGSPVRYQLTSGGVEDGAWAASGFDDSGWHSGVGAVGDDGEPFQSLHLGILADSAADWSDTGRPGLHGWVYGFYRQEGDSDGAYHHTRDFEGMPAGVHFAEGSWRFGGEDPFAAVPEVIRISAVEMACIPSVPKREVWAIRRWISNHTGSAVAELSLRLPVEGSVAAVRLVHNGHIVFDSRHVRDAEGDRRYFCQLEIAEGDAVEVACVALAGAPPGAAPSLVEVPVVARILALEGESAAVADSLQDWVTGAQGENGWTYGVYHEWDDADGSYDTNDLVSEAPEWNFINGSWQLGTIANPSQRPPWDRISRDSVHPGTWPGASARWVVRRWTSDFSGEAYGRVHLEKLGGGGNGVTGRVYRNGADSLSVTIAGAESEGVTFLVPLGAVEVGDEIDFAIDSLGTDGLRTEAVDGTACQLTVHPGSLDLGQAGYSGFIDTPLARSALGDASSVMVRYPFEVDGPESVGALLLRVRASTLFIAYLNGEPVAAGGGAAGGADPVGAALRAETFDLGGSAGLLSRGENVLAVRAYADPVVGDPFLLAPELVASRAPHAPPIRLSAQQPMDAVWPVAAVTGRCTDPEGDALVYVGAEAVSGGVTGSTLWTAGGYLRYTAPPGFVGEDEFVYVVADASGLTSEGLVTVDVLADTEPPRVRSARVTGEGDEVALRYSEPVDAGRAAETESYMLEPPVAVLAAEPVGDGSCVVLSLAGPPAGAGEGLAITVAGQRDGSGNEAAVQTLPVGAPEVWPPIPDPAPYIPQANLFAVEWYHVARYSYGEYIGAHEAAGDYLNMGRWVDFSAMAHDGDGVPLYGTPAGIRVYNPSRIELHCLSMYGKYIRGEGSAEPFIDGVERLLTLQDGRGAFQYPFDYVHHYLNTPLEAGWTSALAQGFGLSVLSRAYLLTGDGRYLTAGEAALEYLLTPVEEGGPATTLADLDPSLASLMWLEEWPVSPTPYTLNGFTFTLLGLYDWAQLPGDLESSARADAAFHEGMATLEVIYPYFNAGGYTTYDLRQVLTTQAPFFAGAYHAVHVGTVNALRSLTHSRVLQEMEMLWASQVERPTRMVVSAAESVAIGGSLPVTALLEFRGGPVVKGSDYYSDVMGNVLIDGVTLGAVFDGGPAVHEVAGELGEAEINLAVPAAYGESAEVPVDVSFEGWAEYTASAGRVEVMVTGSGELELQTVPGAGYVKLLWDVPQVGWNYGYRVYRAAGADGPWGEITAGGALAADTSGFIDWTASPGLPYFYRLTTVGEGGGGTDFSMGVGATARGRPSYELEVVREVGSTWVKVLANGMAGETYILERSSDLRTWEFVGGGVAGEGEETILLDEASAASREAYRVLLDPFGDGG